MTNIEQHSLFMEELELEYQFKHQAEEQLKRHLDEKTQAGAAIETPIGRGLIDYLYDNLAANIKAFLVDIETPKRGVKPIYYPLVMWLLGVYKDNRQDLISLLSLATITEAVNGAHVQETLSDISMYTCEHILDESALHEYIQIDTVEIISLLRGLKYRKSNFYRRYFI